MVILPLIMLPPNSFNDNIKPAVILNNVNKASGYPLINVNKASGYHVNKASSVVLLLKMTAQLSSINTSS